jgi:hypothetical protein
MARTEGAADPSAIQPLPRSRAALWNYLSLVCLLAALLPFLAPKFPIGTDAYAHLMVARIFADLRNPAFRYFDYFSIHWRPLSTILGDLSLALLVKVFGPVAALKAYYFASAAVLWLIGRRYLKALNHPAFAAMLFLPWIQSLYTFFGLLPFIAAVALYPLLLAIVINSAPAWRKSVSLAATLVLLYGFHVVGAAIGTFTVVIYSLSLKRPRVNWVQLSSLIPLCLLLFFARSSEYYSGGHTAFFNPLGQIKSYVAYNAWSLSSVATGAFLVMLVLFAFVAGWHIFQKRIRDPRLLLISVALVVIGLAMPYNLGAEFIVGSRTLPFAFIAAVGAIDWEKKLLHSALAAACACIAVSTVANTKKALAIQPAYRVFLSGLSVIRPGSMVLPVIENMNQGGNKYIQPFNSIETLYNIYRGGANPYVYAEPHVHTGGNLLHARYSDHNLDKFEPLNPAKIGSVLGDYDYVICWGALPNMKPVVASQLTLLFENGPLSIYGQKAHR